MKTMLKLDNTVKLFIGQTIILLAIFVTTNPGHLGFGGVLAVFIYIYFWLYVALIPINGKFNWGYSSLELAVISFLPLLLLSLSSLGQLSKSDMLIVLLLAFVTLLYLQRHRKH